MASKIKLVGLAAVLSLGFGGCLSASVLNVLGSAEIFAAGQGLFDPMGTLPPTVSFAAGAGQTLTFSSVTGSVTCAAGCGPVGPDGLDMGAAGTNVSAPGTGISSIQFTGRELFLVGVFLDNNTPSGAGPAPLPAYTNASVLGSVFSPGIAQVFFIGDGQGTAGMQTFNIPTTATRLFLGFADGTPGFNGIAGAYGDNGGSLTATFLINTTAAVTPEPATCLLLALGIAALSFGRVKLRA